MREDLLKYLAPAEERFEFSGKAVILREMDTAAEVEAMNDQPDGAWRMFVRCVFDEAGNPVFNDNDIPALKKSGTRKLSGIFAKVMALNGMDLKGLAKKSEAGPAAG